LIAHVPLQPKTEQFIEELQSQFDLKLTHPRDVGFLLEQAGRQGLDQVFRDAIFHAKFVLKTKELMARIGQDGEGYDKLSTEFQNSIEKTSTLLKTIIKESSEEDKQRFIAEYLAMDQISFGNFVALLGDLSWVKNWEVDGKALPLAERPAVRSRDRRDTTTPGETAKRSMQQELGSVRAIAVFGILMMILLFISDPPATLLGWGFSGVVVMVLVYITLASHSMAKRSHGTK
jgi:hypothetical protein